MKTIWYIGLALLLTGCATGTGKKWYAPATWFSSRPATAVEHAVNNENKAEAKVLRDVQEFASQTGFALARAPASEPVALAIENNDTVVRLLDQALGPLPVGRANDLKLNVDWLLSDNTRLKTLAQVDRASRVRQAESDSAALAKAREAYAKANRELLTAFARENELADTLRVQRARFWIVVAIAGVLAVGFLYLRITLGGLPQAAGRFMAAVRVKHPDVADNLTTLFDSFLNRSEQDAVRKNAGGTTP